MNGSALMAPSQVNLDEFEQRLRMAGSPVAPQEDPLEELARLVGLEADEPRAGAPTPEPPTRADPPRLPQVHLLQVSERDEEAAPPSAAVPPRTPTEPPLRVALETPPSFRNFAPQDNRPQAPAGYEVRPGVAQSDHAPPAPRGSRRRVVALGLLVTVGAAALGGVWVLKGAPGLPRAPALILAADGPTKIKPPSQDDVQSSTDTAVLLKDQSGRPEPIRIVSNQEQPNDLQQQGRPQPTDAAAPAPAADASAPVAGAPHSLAAGTVGPTAAPAAPASPFPEPKRVKTVSVRPDGSLIPNGDQGADAGPVPGPAEPAASPPAAPAALAANPPSPVPRPLPPASGAPLPATPKLDLPTKLSPKSTARVPIPKTDTTVANAAGASPEAPLQLAPAAEKPAKVARPPKTEVAAADPAQTAPPASGAWAVQLAAPPSEKEAQTVSTRLAAKYAAELGGLQPTIHEADSNGKQIFRVRLSGLSKADAADLCTKLKASGGACFIARE